MKAVSIALVPIHEADISWFLALSKQVGGGETFLNRQDKRPHATLSMGILSDAEEQKIRGVLSTWGEIELQCADMSAVKRAVNLDLIWLNLERNDELMRVHAKAMELIGTSESSVLPEYFAMPKELTGREVTYVQNFESQAFQQFEPHVTLGYGHCLENHDLKKISFRVGLFQLGSSCTCHTELS